VGRFANTPSNTVQLFRCGSYGHPGCGKILTEGQVECYGGCPRCGSLGVSPTYPKTFFRKILCYLLLLRTGELFGD
jgi:hypothetical protein